MAKICTTEKTASRQRWIENGLLELMQEREFDNITVTDLCQRLELSRRSFYRYFRDLEDVLDALMNHTFQDMVITDGSLSISSLERHFAFWYGQRGLISALARSGMLSKITQYALKHADAENLKNHLSSRDLAMDLDQEMNLFVICGLSSLLIGWHADGFQKTTQQMANIAYRMLCEPLLTHT